jgi:hypothetical protein
MRDLLVSLPPAKSRVPQIVFDQHLELIHYDIDNNNQYSEYQLNRKVKFTFIYSINDPDKLLGWLEVNNYNQMIIVPVSTEKYKPETLIASI